MAAADSKTFPASVQTSELELKHRKTIDFSGHVADIIRRIAFLASGHLVIADDKGKIKIWSRDHKECLQTMQANIEPACGIDEKFKRASPLTFASVLTTTADGKLVSGCFSDYLIRVWNTGLGKCEHWLQGHTGCIHALELLPKSRIASGASDGTIRVWDINTGQCIHVLGKHKGPIYSLAFLPEKFLWSTAPDDTMRQWNIDDGQCVRIVTVHCIHKVCITSKFLIFNTVGKFRNLGKILIRDIYSAGGIAPTLFTISKHGIKITDMVALDSRLLLIAGDKGGLYVCDVEKQSCVAKIKGHTVRISRLLRLPNGVIISCAINNTVKFWHLSGWYTRRGLIAYRIRSRSQLRASAITSGTMTAATSLGHRAAAAREDHAPTI